MGPQCWLGVAVGQPSGDAGGCLSPSPETGRVEMLCVLGRKGRGEPGRSRTATGGMLQLLLEPGWCLALRRPHPGCVATMVPDASPSITPSFPACS